MQCNSNCTCNSGSGINPLKQSLKRFRFTQATNNTIMSYNFRTPCLLVIMPKCSNLSFWSSELLIVKEWIWTSFLSFSGWKLIQIQALFNQDKITTELFIETPLEWFLLCCVSPIFLAVRKRVQNRIPALSGHWLGWKESLSQCCHV